MPMTSVTVNVVIVVKASIYSNTSQSEITVIKKATNLFSQAEIMPNEHLFGNSTSLY